jgi:hypothetical protein
MRELQLRVENPELTINGHVFALGLSDLELFMRAQALFQRYEHFADAPRAPGEVLAAAGDVSALLEAALGQGAIGIISGGKPVSLSLAIKWLGSVAREAAEHYAETALEEDAMDED